MVMIGDGGGNGGDSGGGGGGDGIGTDSSGPARKEIYTLKRSDNKVRTLVCLSELKSPGKYGKVRKESTSTRVVSHQSDAVTRLV
jgi:hypothetical protein